MRRRDDRRSDWFKLADYEAQRNFSLAEWAVMLWRRIEWRDTFPSIHLPQEQKAAYWRDYLGAVLPCNIILHPSLPCNFVLHPSGSDHETWVTPPPPIVDITDKCAGGSTQIVSPFEMQIFGTRVLIINTCAPDTVLIKQFNDWVREQRKRSPLPATRRGKPSANVEITDDHIGSWSRYNVLAVLDLDLYAQVFGIKPLSSESLGKFLECNRDSNAKNWGRAARAKAAEAVRYLDVLTAQIQAKKSAT
jgi:hypothetical protein